MNAPLLVLLAICFVPMARAQVLPPGFYYDFVGQRTGYLGFYVDTNRAVQVTWARHVNPITGSLRHGISAIATNKPDGTIRCTFRGRGDLRGRVVLGETNSVVGTLFLWGTDGQQGVARHFKAKDI